MEVFQFTIKMNPVIGEHFQELASTTEHDNGSGYLRINGTAANNRTGQSAALSGDGETLAVQVKAS